MNFKGVPDIMPVEKLTAFTLQDLEKRRVAELEKEECKDEEQLRMRSKEELVDISKFAYEENKEPTKKDFMKRFKVIRTRQHTFAKPLAIIFNPKAGRGTDLREAIKARFEGVQVAFEILDTNHQYHAYEIAKSMEFNDFSGLIIVGGDGTISEAINGMLVREDGARLPVGLVPNGSSNDLCRSLGIKSVDYALDFILKK